MNLQKHAYLIMAHNNFYCLEKLLMLLDDPRNDIFLHIDAKVKDFDFAKFQAICQYARVICPKKRINVQWGTQSQVHTEMMLFQTAVSCGSYHYYHLISGVDLPLKTQDEIHLFFAEKEECFITIHEETTRYDYQRLSRYHNVFPVRTGWGRWMNQHFAVVQEGLGIDRLRGMKDQIFKRGWNWVSLPQKAVELLLEKSKYINKITRHTMCADEVYKQIVLLNTTHPEIKIHDSYSSLRLVDWTRGSGSHPHVFTSKDFDLLTGSNMLFARKFDENVDRQIIDMVCDHVMQKQKPEAEK